ncbi:MAG TPA: enoyl-CoA hydratase, partial [Achromobacter sp.]
LTKAMLRRPDRQAIQDTMDYEAQQFRIRLQSEEAQAAFAKFFKK